MMILLHQNHHQRNPHSTAKGPSHPLHRFEQRPVWISLPSTDQSFSTLSSQTPKRFLIDLITAIFLPSKLNLIGSRQLIKISSKLSNRIRFSIIIRFNQYAVNCPLYSNYRPVPSRRKESTVKTINKTRPIISREIIAIFIFSKMGTGLSYIGKNEPSVTG